MPDFAVRVDGLSKRYRIGRLEDANDTLGGAIVNLARRPIRNLRNLRRLSRFGDDGDQAEDVIWALKDVSFEVPYGQSLGIIGRNGAGKSTLLRILSRITEPTSGRALTAGRVSSLLEVGTGFHPELTGRENVFLNGAVLGMGRAEIVRKFDEIVEFSGVERFIDTPVKRYSSGMQVRLAFAVAAHLEPEVLIVDEVLAVGDAEFQRRCLGRMDSIAGEGRTVLFVSHHLASVTNLCSRAVLLGRGRIAAIGDTSAVVTQYVSGLESSLQANLADREDRQGDGRIRFTDIWLETEHMPRVSTLRSGDSVNFRLQYARANADGRLDNIKCWAVVKDSSGIPVFTLASGLSGSNLEARFPEGCWTCQVESLPLQPDRYTIDLWCWDRDELTDKVEHSTEFSVVQGDFFHTGRFLQHKNTTGLVLVKQNWHTT